MQVVQVEDKILLILNISAKCGARPQFTILWRISKAIHASNPGPKIGCPMVDNAPDMHSYYI